MVMKNILIPIDFSQHSLSAARTGCFIAKKCDATIHLIHIVRAPEDWEILSESQQNRNVEIKNKIEDAETEANTYARLPIFEKLNVIPRVFGGVPYKAILEYASAYKTDLIVMGAHGQSESSQLFIGSTAQKVLRDASCLVLSVKKNFKPISLNRILFASDFAGNDIKKSVKTFSDFAEDISARLDFAFINTPGEFTDSQTIELRLKNLQGIINPKKHKLFIQNDYYKDQGIINVARKIKTNMLALPTHNRRYKRNYQLGTTETLLFKTDTPVLSLVM
jgi:nucleotide-binding universal stress UspA family protein